MIGLMRRVCILQSTFTDHKIFLYILHIRWQETGGGAAEVPKVTLKDVEKRLKEEEKALFLSFAEKMLKWKPEDRSSAKELLGDPWLNRV